jgi:predicted metal-dependent HD superfamily phosphohydrolase
MPSTHQWHGMWNGLGGQVPENLYQDVLARHNEPHRRYHTVQHLDECLANLAGARSAALQPHEIELALWFHDAIYDVKRDDNEQRSADWARSSAVEAGLPAAIADRVHALIMATRHDAVPIGTDERLVIDIDLWILGAPEERFDEYECQVREEYSWVPASEFAAKRRAILEHFLARPRIFNTEAFFRVFESRARSNLQRSIAQLGS